MKIESAALDVIKGLQDAAIVYTFGNGGSASIANHMACDWTKSTGGVFRVISLAANPSMIMAIANDCGYEETCRAQLDWLMDGEETVVLVSSSGNSPNIVKAAEFVKDCGCTLIGFTGFDGGALKQLCDISVHIDSNDYGVIEDYHSQVMHEVVRQINSMEDL